MLNGVCYNGLIKKYCWTELGRLWWRISVWASINSVDTWALQAVISLAFGRLETSRWRSSGVTAISSRCAGAKRELSRSCSKGRHRILETSPKSALMAAAPQGCGLHRAAALPSQPPPCGPPLTAAPSWRLRAAAPWFAHRRLCREARCRAISAPQRRGRVFSPFPGGCFFMSRWIQWGAGWQSGSAGAMSLPTCPPAEWPAECLCTTANPLWVEAGFFATLFNAANQDVNTKPVFPWGYKLEYFPLGSVQTQVVLCFVGSCCPSLTPRVPGSTSGDSKVGATFI